MKEQIDFYQKLTSFTDFVELTDKKHFIAAPESWILVMTDVKGSTRAISEGRYKEVNVVGAATIIATHNACQKIEFPFVFGGDGATILIPAPCLDNVKRALSHTRRVAKQQFGLDLRIATIPLTKIYSQQKEVLVAKLELTPKNSIAMIQGGGVSLGEKWMKESSEYTLAEDYQASGELKGLECRWNPVQASLDGMLTMIIQVQEQVPNPNRLYREILDQILVIAPSAQPVTPKKMALTWPPKHLYAELKMKNLNWFLQKTAQGGLLLLTWIFSKLIKQQLADSSSKANIYLHQLSKNTDYIKFDDTLRMIIDVTSEQENNIRKFLTQEYAENKIYFGLHMAKEALMTCFVQSLDQHIHFLDGGDGGYAMAAKELKQQKKKI